jgi:16S rRNA (uracil1498-N3)-methyltransferase
MRLHRFYVSQPLGEDVVINELGKIKQWTKVFRYTKGDFVILFNGDGIDATYSIETLSPKECTLVRTKQESSYVPEKKITLYLSIIKKDTFELVVEKATELGVTTIIPILSERSEKKSLNLERLRAITIESAEQCGRGDIPTIMPIIPLGDVLELPSPHDISYVLQMNGVPVQDERGQNYTNIGYFVGPEGGWTKHEEETFTNKKSKFISLGKTTLRAETAAIVGCAFLNQ